MIFTALALVLTSTPLSLFSQNAPDSNLEEWVIELAYLKSQLAPIEERALLEPDLAQQQDALGEVMLAAMVEADPTVRTKLERLRAIALEARSTADPTRLDALGAEAHALQPAIDRAKAKASKEPDVAAGTSAFRKALCDRMAQLAPESRGMVSRYEELERLINSSVRQGSSPRPVIGL
jgi:hypothetical protein